MAHHWNGLGRWRELFVCGPRYRWTGLCISGLVNRCIAVAPRDSPAFHTAVAPLADFRDRAAAAVVFVAILECDLRSSHGQEQVLSDLCRVLHIHS